MSEKKQTAAPQTVAPMTDTGEAAPKKRRRKYLVIVAEAPETRLAAYYAARRAKHSKGEVALLYVVEPPDFSHWTAVSDAMRAEELEKGEALLDAFAAEIAEVWDGAPQKLLREGRRIEEVRKVIESDPDIAILALGAADSEEGPGPLVAELAARPAWLGKRPVPVIVVPGSMTREELRGLS